MRRSFIGQIAVVLFSIAVASVAQSENAYDVFLRDTITPALSGDSDAQYRYAVNLMAGDVVAQDLDNANAFFYRAASAGHTGAMLAVSFLNSAGVSFPFKKVEKDFFYSCSKDALKKCASLAQLKNGESIGAFSINKFSSDEVSFLLPTGIRSYKWDLITSTTGTFWSTAVSFALAYETGKRKEHATRQRQEDDLHAEMNRQLQEQREADKFIKDQEKAFKDAETKRLVDDLLALFNKSVREKYRESVAFGRTIIGMTANEVFFAKGYPNRLYRETTVSGEQMSWAFDDGTTCYFTDGTLVRVVDNVQFADPTGE
jgi:hypothetical protein